MKNNAGPIAALLGTLFCVNLHASTVVKPVIAVKGVPANIGAPGAAVIGGSRRVMLATPGLMSPSTLPTLRSLVKPSIRRSINAPAAAAVSKHQTAAIAIKSRVSADGIRVSVYRRKMSGKSVAASKNELAGVGKKSQQTEHRNERPSASHEIRTAAKYAREFDYESDFKAALEHFGSVFDGEKHKRHAPATKTPEEARTIAEKTSRKTGYLEETKGLSGQVLLKKIHEIEGRGYRSHSYKEAAGELFSNIDNFKKDGVRGVLAAYSGVFVPGKGSDGSKYRERGDANGDGYANRDGMNVEHIWPQSYFNRRAPMRSDLHHLMATFTRPNSERSNYPFGEVPDSEVEYSNRAGARLGRGIFEPPDAVKGRVARAALYFYSKYYNRGILPASRANLYWNTRIEMFLRWNEAFPPDAFELRRNDLVEQYQGNRNPFVDDPGLARRVGAEAFMSKRGGRNLARSYETSGGGVQEHGRAHGRSEGSLETSGRSYNSSQIAGQKSRKNKKKKRGHRKKRRKHGR